MLPFSGLRLLALVAAHSRSEQIQSSQNNLRVSRISGNLLYVVRRRMLSNVILLNKLTKSVIASFFFVFLVISNNVVRPREIRFP
ncbi:hypothetical protein C8R41DRAFT_810494 [Lentinula lateritia]|uniref:Secreted protein n=1 Tax=Lentinula lateritia TaxID=40482 RepID=A0ABQ8VZM0_9AGAR|nr:hypothetical protein C8R41DRAFT_810494 [Lentinula lateritia]